MQRHSEISGRVMQRVALTTLLVVSLAGCSQHATLPVSERAAEHPSSMHLSPTKAATQQSHGALYGALERHYSDWKGTPYLYGGQSRSGIDCSGFVQMTMAKLQGLQLPRTTEKLLQEGSLIDSGHLQTGDLVFFQINANTRHVGIYLSDQKFLHASKSKGVTISRLDSPYWMNTYRQSRRVLDTL